MKLRLLLAAALVLAFAGSALAGTKADAKYKLYYLAPGGAVRVMSSDPLPSGSNVPPDNQWRYEYTVLNKWSSNLFRFIAYYNSDDVARAGWVSGTYPASWTLLKMGPASGHNNFSIYYQTTVPAAQIPTNSMLMCTGTFTWTGDAVPGAQNYDAVFTGTSESGVTVEDVATPTRAETWGRIKSLYQ